jgi:hypothetical protein
MHTIQDELNEVEEKVSKLCKDSEELKKYFTKKGDEFAKMQYLNKAFIKEISKLKQENMSFGKN